MAIINFLRRVFAFALVGILSIGITSNGAKPHTVLDEENCKTCITVLSDSHIEGNNMKRFNGFGRILRDAKNNSYGSDVGVFLGDNTMNGQDIESLFFYGLVASNRFADNYINVMGNHDIGNGNGDYDKLSKRFYNYTEAFMGIKTNKPYYCKVINGCYFIVLGEEQLSVDYNEMSDEQFEFLRQSLEKAKADNAVAFVCAHHPVYNVVSTAKSNIWNILSSYKNVFYISGHTHMEVEEGWTFEDLYGIHMINLPRCTENMGDGDEITTENCGIGMQIEVYEDEVVARARNYYFGTWVDGFEKHYTIEK